MRPAIVVSYPLTECVFKLNDPIGGFTKAASNPVFGSSAQIFDQCFGLG